MAAALLLGVLLLSAQQAAAPQTAEPQSTPPQITSSQTAPPQTTPSVSVDDLPVSVDRIQRALAGPPPIELREQHPVFRLEIFGRKPTIEDILGEKFWVGPAPYGGMTHQEFMSMVTPQLAQPYAGFTGKYLLAESALTVMEQWALKSAIRHFRDARGEHDREVARKEVLDALAQLERARHAAGLPEK